MPALSPDTPFFIVFNQASGSGDARAAQAEMQELLASHQRRHEFFVVEDAKQIERCAERAVEAAVREQGAVIVAGGDGTINAVAQATLPTERPFGILPQGTFNYTTRSQGIPLDPKQATLALLDAQISPMQVGLLNDRVFLVNASLGLYPELLENREQDKKRHGRYRAVAFWSGLKSLVHEHRQLRLEIEHDGERELVRTPALFVGNNHLQLERAGLAEADAVEHHRLAGVLVRPVSTLSLLWLALRGALGQLGGAERVRDFSFRRLSVTPRRHPTRPLKVATDGEIRWMKPPLVFSVAPKALQLMTPSAAAKEAS
ncbi:MAG TPA: diacylglycerol kinase family protein [Polyangiaceae bacterium]|nr:diacylglycerol kinase family protein [Polyangiaceae bacterium]